LQRRIKEEYRILPRRDYVTMSRIFVGVSPVLSAIVVDRLGINPTSPYL
jgi:hypothetical protein